MIHKRKLRDVQSAVRCHQNKPYQPTITMRNAKKDAMLESKYTNKNGAILINRQPDYSLT